MPGGNEAIETAIRLARIATGRSGIISFQGSYHGHGLGCLGLSSARTDPRLGSHLPDIHHITPYWDKSGADASLQDLERTLAVQGKLIACFVAEPMRSNCHVPPKRFWPEASRLCHKAGVKLVFDEIPSGLGKTGRFFAHEHFDVTPDLVVLGKALGGGMLPVAAVIGDDALNVAPELKVGHFTHEKNPLLACAALTTLQIIDDERLVEQAKSSGDYLETRVKELAGEGIPISLRGLGLLRAVEITNQHIDANLIVSELLQLGVSCDAKDAHSLGFSPPLSIARQDLDNALTCMAKAVSLKLG
jgi:4-aminobutyrate aminotransferase